MRKAVSYFISRFKGAFHPMRTKKLFPSRTSIDSLMHNLVGVVALLIAIPYPFAIRNIQPVTRFCAKSVLATKYPGQPATDGWSWTDVPDRWSSAQHVTFWDNLFRSGKTKFRVTNFLSSVEHNYVPIRGKVVTIRDIVVTVRQ